LQQRSTHTLRAAILSPLAAVPVFVAWYLVYRFFFMGPEDIADEWVWLLIFLGYVLFVAYAASFLVAIPIDWLLRRLGLHSLIAYTVTGGVVGGLIGIAILPPPSPLTLATILCGGAISMSFRMIASSDNWTRRGGN